MKKFCLLVSFALFCVVSMLSCVSACESLKEEAHLPLALHILNINGSFDEVVNNTVIDVEFRQSPDVVAELYCPAEYREYVDVSVVQGELWITLKDNLSNSTKNEVSRKLRDSKLFLTAPELRGINVNGSSVFTVVTDLRTDSLNAVLNGSGDIDFNGVQCLGKTAYVNVQVNGSGDITFGRELKAEKVYMQVNGSGDIDCTIVTARNVGSQVNGSGDIEVDELYSVSSAFCVNGSGDLKLQGECETVNYSVISSGDISAKNLVAQDVSASVSGSGDIECNAQRALTVEVIGSGSIGYRGNPQVTYLSKRDNIHRIE